jgi:chromosome partitioning protein
VAIISLANAKGGAGKTTAAVLLAAEYARKGKSVLFLDCDRLSAGAQWCGRVGLGGRVDAINGVTASNLAEHLRYHRGRYRHVLIDLSGASDMLIALASGLSDLVLVPVQGSFLDGHGAVHVFNIIDMVMQNARCRVRRAVLLSRVNPLVTTRSLRHVAAMLAEKDIPMLATPVVERSAFRDIFEEGRLPAALDSGRTSNIDKALANMAALAHEVKVVITEDEEAQAPFSSICFHAAGNAPQGKRDPYRRYASASLAPSFSIPSA